MRLLGSPDQRISAATSPAPELIEQNCSRGTAAREKPSMYFATPLRSVLPFGTLQVKSR
jgi:hypothetical protein